VENQSQGVPVEPPRGMYAARVDDKGRVKMPVDFQRYFAELGEGKFFITSLDRRIGQVYPLSVWRQNEEFFASRLGDPKKKRRVAFNANDLGGQAEFDAQGRLLFPAEMRRELGIEGQPIRVYFFGRRVEVLSDKIYEEQKREGQQTAPEDVVELESAGLQ